VLDVSTYTRILLLTEGHLGGVHGSQVGIAVAGSIFSDYEITPDGDSFIILQGGEGQTTQNHVTLVTHWFDILRATLPGS